MRHRLHALVMDADKAGAWMPVVCAFLLLSMAGLGLWNIPQYSDVEEGTSGNTVPRFVEHFPNNVSDAVPVDDVIRMSWHPEESELGTLKTDDRYMELGENKIVDHASIPSQAILHVTVLWSSEQSLNVSVNVNLTANLENGILRLILIEDGVEMFGRDPSQHAVVRLYDPTPIGNGNGTIQRELQLGSRLSINDAERLRFVILLSDMMTEENQAMLSLNVPIAENGPAETGQRVSILFALGAITLTMAAIIRSEWKREVMLPKLRGSRDDLGRPVAHLKAGLRDLKLREVRVQSPWRMAKEIREIELSAGMEKVFHVRVKPERGQSEVLTDVIETEWSIEVDEMGGWVLDLTMYKERST